MSNNSHCKISKTCSPVTSHPPALFSRKKTLFLRREARDKCLHRPGKLAWLFQPGKPDTPVNIAVNALSEYSSTPKLSAKNIRAADAIAEAPKPRLYGLTAVFFNRRLLLRSLVTSLLPSVTPKCVIIAGVEAAACNCRQLYQRLAFQTPHYLKLTRRTCLGRCSISYPDRRIRRPQAGGMRRNPDALRY